MTEREKNGERLAMKISRHRQAKHEAIQYEDVKTAYIKGCEDTAKENSGNLDDLIKENVELRKIAEHQQATSTERYFENERTRKTALLNLDGWRKSDAKLERARALLEQWLQTTHAGGCDNVNLGAETEQFLAGDL